MVVVPRVPTVQAVGETVIILIAGGQQANLSLNLFESYQSMAAYIAATARGDIPTGSIEYETIFIVGMLAFAAHLGWQVARIDIDDPAQCLTLFRSNRDAGLILFAAMLLDAAF